MDRSGSAGDVTLLPETTKPIIRGRTGHRREIGEQTRTITTNSEDQLTQTEDTITGAVGGWTLLNIPPCSMAGEPGEQSQSLFRLPMSDPELNLECQRGARPKTAAPLTTHTIQEEARSSFHRAMCLAIKGHRFLFTFGGTT